MKNRRGLGDENAKISARMQAVRNLYTDRLNEGGVRGLMIYLVARHEQSREDSLNTAVVVFSALHAWASSAGGTTDDKRARMRQALKEVGAFFVLEPDRSPRPTAYRVALELLEGSVSLFLDKGISADTPWRHELCAMQHCLAQYALHGHMGDERAGNDVRDPNYGDRLESAIASATEGIRTHFMDCRLELAQLTSDYTQLRRLKELPAPRPLPAPTPIPARVVQGTYSPTRKPGVKSAQPILQRKLSIN